MPDEMEKEEDGRKELTKFFRTLEVRWAMTNLVLPALIRHAAVNSNDSSRFVAAVFDDASALVDATMDSGADPKIGNELHKSIDLLAADIADDLRAFRSS